MSKAHISSFKQVKLGEIAYIEMGQSPDSQYVFEDTDTGVAFLQGNAEFGTIFPTPKYGCTQPIKLASTNDILISVRAPVGAVNIADRPYCIGRGLAAIRVAGCSPSLAAYLIFRQSSALHRIAQGTTFEAINKNDLLNLELLVPPINECGKIAQILDTLDSAIHETEAIIAKLQSVKQGLLHDLLTRGLDTNGQLRPPPALAPERYKDSPLGLIPREWAVVAFEDIAEVSRGKFTHRPRNDPAFYGGAYPFIQTGDVSAANGSYVTTFSQTLNERGAKVSQEFPAETIAITIAANIADTAILSASMCFPDSVVGAIVCSSANVRYVELCVRRAKRTLDARATQSAQKNINLQDLRPLLIALPTKKEQEQIATRYEILEQRISEEKNSHEKLIKQKSGLMDDLLTGRVRVKLTEAEAA